MWIGGSDEVAYLNKGSKLYILRYKATRSSSSMGERGNTSMSLTTRVTPSSSLTRAPASSFKVGRTTPVHPIRRCRPAPPPPEANQRHCNKAATLTDAALLPSAPPSGVYHERL